MRRIAIARSPRDTLALGNQLASRLRGSEILVLSGELGSGKTLFTKGIANGLGIEPSEVISPTFVLLRIYRGRLTLYHADVYRLREPSAVVSLGLEDASEENGVVVIEWGDRVREFLPEGRLQITFRFQTRDTREIEFSADGQRHNSLLDENFPPAC